MKVSFTQTYGDDRRELYKILNNDICLLDFKEKFDLIIYSFHNCSEETIEYFKSLPNINNSNKITFLIHNNEHYSDTIIKLLDYLKRMNCTHLFFTQDDTFSIKDFNYNELFEYVSRYDNNFMLSLMYSFKELFLDTDKINTTKHNTFTVCESTSIDIHDLSMWGTMDDSPYICTFDLLLDIYNDEYLSHKNIWDMEMFIVNRYKHEKLNRFTLNDKLLKNYNLYGKSLGNVVQDRIELIDRKLL